MNKHFLSNTIRRCVKRLSMKSSCSSMAALRSSNGTAVFARVRSVDLHNRRHVRDLLLLGSDCSIHFVFKYAACVCLC